MSSSLLQKSDHDCERQRAAISSKSTFCTASLNDMQVLCFNKSSSILKSSIITPSKLMNTFLGAIKNLKAWLDLLRWLIRFFFVFGLTACTSNSQSASVKVVLCNANSLESTSTENMCSRESTFKKVFSLPRRVAPDFPRTSDVHFVSHRLTLHVYLTKYGAIEPPKPTGLSGTDIQAHTVWLYTVPESYFDEALKMVVEGPAMPSTFDPERRGGYVLNQEKDSVFNIFEYRVDSEIVGKGGPYPMEILTPKDGSRIYIECVKSWKLNNRMTNPLCQVSDFQAKNLRINYTLYRDRLNDFSHYSAMVHRYIESITINE